jgi:hypothetical protein
MSVLLRFALGAALVLAGLAVAGLVLEFSLPGEPFSVGSVSDGVLLMGWAALGGGALICIGGLLGRLATRGAAASAPSAERLGESSKEAR